MPNQEKVEKVAILKERMDASQALLLADYRGLTVADAKEFRTMLAEADARFVVAKNTLVKLAADQAGMAEIGSMLTGPTGVAFIEGDPVLAAKRFDEAAQKFPALILKGGFMDGKVLSEKEAKALAKLESREVMLSKIAGLMKSEMSRAAQLFQAMPSQFLALAEALKEKLPAADAPATPEAETPAEAPAEVEAPAETEVPEAPAPDEAPADEEAPVTDAGAAEEAATEAEAPAAEATDEAASSDDPTGSDTESEE